MNYTRPGSCHAEEALPETETHSSTTSEWTPETSTGKNGNKQWDTEQIIKSLNTPGSELHMWSWDAHCRRTDAPMPAFLMAIKTDNPDEDDEDHYYDDVVECLWHR